MNVTTWTVPDPRAQFDQAMEATRSGCSALEPAIDRRDPACVSIANSAAFAWVAARTACRALFSVGPSGAPDPFAGAARRLLESQARVLGDQLVKAAQMPLGTGACTRLKALYSLLMRMMDAPLVDADRAPPGEARAVERT